MSLCSVLAPLFRRRHSKSARLAVRPSLEPLEGRTLLSAGAGFSSLAGLVSVPAGDLPGPVAAPGLSTTLRATAVIVPQVPQGQPDSLSGLSTNDEELSLQMTMDRLATLVSLVSNVTKDFDGTANTLVSNAK